MVLFLTHDFKPVFSKTLKNLDSSLNHNLDATILFDSSKPIPENLDLGKISLVAMDRHPSPFDPIGQAHNFYLDFISDNSNLLDLYDYFWILENDVYYHGNIREFFDIHSYYDYDLLVPEIGLRHRNWCWLNHIEGFDVKPIGTTLVFYRISSRFMRYVVENINLSIVAHMEVALLHMCFNQGFTSQQFIPDYLGLINSFRSPLINLIEKDIIEGTEKYIQKKMYHPIKL
jgi:hypothetical protein